MKKTLFVIAAFYFLLSFSSCSKKQDLDGIITCNSSPTTNLSFYVINENNNDLFFSATPLYQLTDIKIYFKNYNQKIDSVIPYSTAVNAQKCFSFSSPRGKITDTCYVKVKNLKPDTIIYTASSLDYANTRPFIKSVKVNNSATLNISANTVVQLKVNTLKL